MRFYDHHGLAFTIITWIWLIVVFVMNTRRALRQRVILTEHPGTAVTDSEPVRFRLKRSISGSDATQSTSLRELAAVLSALGVETADVTGVVVDEKGFVYRSNPLHIPVYRIFPTVGHATLSDPRSAAI